MRVTSRELDFGKSKIAVVNFTACWHEGNQAMHEEGLELMLNGFRKRSEPWIQLGDILEAIIPFDPRYAVDEHKITFVNEVSAVIGHVSLAAETCWGLVTGNHEARASRQLGDITQLVCDGVKLGTGVKLQHLSNVCNMEINCPKGICRGFFAHGAMTANFKSGDADRIELNRKKKLRDYLRRFDANLKGIAHGHRTIIAEPIAEEKLGAKGGKMKREPVTVVEPWCFAAPSMFKVYDEKSTVGNYAEMALYDPTDLGWIQVVFERDGSIPCIRQMLETGEIKEEVKPKVVS